MAEKPKPKRDWGLLEDDVRAVNRRELARCLKREGSGVGGFWDSVLRWLKALPPPEPLPAQQGTLEPPHPDDPHHGICCSGGGVRSAAFNLGALQALQEDKDRVLQGARYLAAVSGGSYIAAAWTMVNRTGPGDSDAELVNDGNPPFHPGSPEEQYLRNRSNYMAPGLVGKGRVISHVVLGALANILFFSLCLFLAGSAAGLIYLVLYPGLDTVNGSADTSLALKICVSLGFAWVLLGFGGVLLNGRAAQVLHTYSERCLPLLVVALGLLVAVPELVEWLRETGDQEDAAKGSLNVAAALGVSGVVATIAGALAQLRSAFAGTRVVETEQRITRGLKRLPERVAARVKRALFWLVVAAVGPLLFGAIFVASVIVAVEADLDGGWVLGALASAVALTGFLAFGNITNWSLHPFYRWRLSTAFALRRKRVPRPCQGIAGGAGAMAEERPYETVIPLMGRRHGTEKQPLLLVCAAANVSDPRATPPGRGVTSFTFSENAMGGPLVGGVSTPEYIAGVPDGRIVTLPGAIAASGAAVSPSMGKLTKTPLRFLMTLANVRLGVWVPNPRRSEEFGTWRSRFDRPGPHLLFRELMGKNKIDARYLYVTDGGHYENLGLVELLRRGCTDVYCFDASGGRDTNELGDAIALARTELGVQIQIETSKLVPDPQSGFAEHDCAIGRIVYPNDVIGTLVYIRSVLTRESPQDVLSYHGEDRAFPHNSTGDQLYTDQKFEAYRSLGNCAAKNALERFKPGYPPPAPASKTCAPPPEDTAAQSAAA